MNKDSWYRGALLSVLFFGGLALLATPSAAQTEGCPAPCPELDEEPVDVTDTVPEDVEDVVVGNPVEPGSNSGYENLGGMAPDVPTEQPRGALAAMKRLLVRRIWNDLTAEQQQQVRDALREWLEEQGYDSCHEAAADPETARTAAEELLNSPAIELSPRARKWANRLLKMSGKKGTATTITIICNQVGM